MTLKAIALRVFPTAILLSVLALPARAQLSGDCASVQMTVTAAITNDPGFVGLYKYTVTGSWDVTRFGLSHLDIFLEMQDCPCRCDNRTFRFKQPAGTSNGYNQTMGLCTALYAGEYLCTRDPSIPASFAAPLVKFDAEDNGCSPTTFGAGTWFFYSPFPPGAHQVYVDAVAIKHGQGVCTGNLTGTLPVCDCTVPSAPATWGKLKSTYR